jgi:hypothetical protein
MGQRGEESGLVLVLQTDTQVEEMKKATYWGYLDFSVPANFLNHSHTNLSKSVQARIPRQQ